MLVTRKRVQNGGYSLINIHLGDQMRKLVLIVFAVLLSTSTLFSIVTPQSDAAVFSCGSICVQTLNSCKAACDGNQACITQCESEYTCCQILCHGGSCRQAK
jgi:hypothetical protein